MTLLLILGGLFLGLALMVYLTGRFAKPLAPEQQQRLSRWIVILIVVLLIASIIRHYAGG